MPAEQTKELQCPNYKPQFVGKMVNLLLLKVTIHFIWLLVATSGVVKSAKVTNLNVNKTLKHYLFLNMININVPESCQIDFHQNWCIFHGVLITSKASLVTASFVFIHLYSLM